MKLFLCVIGGVTWIRIPHSIIAIQLCFQNAVGNVMETVEKTTISMYNIFIYSFVLGSIQFL